MKRHLISQMRNEWRTNIWLAVELTIVGVILYFIFIIAVTLLGLRSGDKGYNLDDTAMAYVRVVPEISPEYVPYDSTRTREVERNLLLAQLRRNPYVEEVGYGGNAMSYNFNYAGSIISCRDGDTLLRYLGNVRNMSPEVMKILQLRGPRGESPEELAAILARGEYVLALTENFHENQCDPRLMLGKRVTFGNDSTNMHTVGGIAYGLQRNDYEPLWNGVIYAPLGPNDWANEIYLRLKPGKSRQFKESLTKDMMQVGNVYVSGFRMVDDLRAYAHLGINTLLRNLGVVGLFVLLMIFFGFLGTFWFRTQQRVGEIAVRKVNGATDADIFRRFLAEGMILLAIALIPIIPIVWWINTLDIASLQQSGVMNADWQYVASAALLTILTLALLIAAGIWMPARKAMKVNAATALKDQ